jgi:hypothetical protein
MRFGSGGAPRVLEARLRMMRRRAGSKVFWKYAGLLGQVSDLQLLAAIPEEEADQDRFEERKIVAFLDAIEPFRGIGTVLPDPEDATASHGAMELEKWPLIQVYGVEELGSIAPTASRPPPAFLTSGPHADNLSSDRQGILFDETSHYGPIPASAWGVHAS